MSEAEASSFSLGQLFKARSIWIIGPPSSGKTTLGRLTVNALRARGVFAMLLDGDEVRSVFDTTLGYDPASRRKQTARVVRLNKWVGRQGILPVVAIIHPFEDDRKACRTEISGYFEVYLRCALPERIKRDRKNLYLPALAGEKRHVVSVDIPFEEPEHPDLVIDTDRTSPDAALEMLILRL